MTNIRDVARACGVSPNTVSSVLNNKAGKVGPETQERVLEMVRLMGYRPKAHQSQAQKLLTLGLLTPLQPSAFQIPGYYQKLHQELYFLMTEHPCNLMIFSSTLFFMDPYQSVRSYCDGRCDGLIILAPPLETAFLEILTKRGTPYVVLGAASSLIGVDVDNVLGAKMAVTHLLKLGHRRIAYSGGTTDYVPCVAPRRDGYRQALRDYGIGKEGWLEHYQHTQDDVAAAKHAIRLWFSRRADQRPTAIFCWNDGAASTMARELQASGVRVPEDVSIVGFDDVHAEFSDPPLTTIRQPYAAIVRQTFQSVLAQIDGAPPLNHDILLPPELIVRDSTAPPRQ